MPKITKKSKIFFFTSFYMFWLIQKYKITHLLAQCPINGGFTATLASKYFKIPLMVEIHGDVYFDYMKKSTIKNIIFSKLTKYSLHNASKIRSLSSSMSIMLNNCGILKGIQVIPNRVDVSLFNSNKDNYDLHDPVKIISIGRFVEQKGYDIAIDAVKTLSIKYKIELYLIGGGFLYDKLVRQSYGFGNINIIKWVGQKKLKILLEESDIYIQPSKPYFGEAMPRTILEAMAMKLPVIATNIAAIPGVLNESNAIVIKPNNVDELILAIEILMHNKSKREKIALQGYNDVIEKYEWNEVFKLYRNKIKGMRYENT